MKLQHHIASSTLVAGIVYLFFKSWNMSLMCLLSGVLMDVDHIYDHIREFGFPFKVKHLFCASYNNEIRQRTVVFHSLEVVFLLGIVAWLTSWNPWITGVLIGFGHHLVLDKLYFRARLLSLSFLWRLKNNFEFEKLFPNVAKKKTKPK